MGRCRRKSLDPAEPDAMERKLTAILSADVAGYSRLVEDDDEATIRTLTEYRAVIQRAIEAHRGRVIDAPGDNLLAEFASVVDAVRCAVEVQHMLHERNVSERAERRMQFRMGINVGDVVVEDDHLYGEGVNIAARLEALADAGGICLSGNAYEQIQNRIGVEFEFIGEQTVKNISKPVAVWRALLNDGDVPDGAADGNGRQTHDEPTGSRLNPVAITVALCVLIGIAGLMLSRQTPPTLLNEKSPIIPSPAEQVTEARPAIVVLPFANHSDDPEQAYFSDGITEDLTTDLSKLNSIFVVSSNAAFRYKGQAVHPAALREEFGVRYMLEGSVRKAGEQVRISARLIDIVENQHLWGERYDRPLTDIFALQDEIGGKILTALRVNLTAEEQFRFRTAPTDNLEAYDFYLRAQELTHRARRELKPELMDDAAALYEKAIALDPDYAVAHGAMGFVHWLRWVYDWGDDIETSLKTALALFEKAEAIDDSNPHMKYFLIMSQLHNQQFAVALAAASDYVKASPQDPRAHRVLAFALILVGQFENALAELSRSEQLTPGRYPAYAYWINGAALTLLGKNREALSVLEQAVLRSPNYLTNQIMLAIVHVRLGNHDKTRIQTKEILRISPDYTAENFEKRLPFEDKAITDGFIAALREAGLP